MPDIPNRPDLEAELARRFSRLSAQHRKKLMGLLGDPPNMGNVPQSFWTDTARELNGTFVPFLTELYMDSAERLAADLPVGVDWGLVNTRAATWAQSYSFDLVREITDTSRRATQESISAFFEQGLTRADLEARLSRIFVGAARIEAIAVTEVTRAAARGEDRIWDELAAQGIEMITTWHTSNDELVCPICRPLNGREADGRDGEGPYWIHPKTGITYHLPAHPRDRCFENNELPKVGRG